MLEDFLISLKSVNGNGRVKRVVLQTGAKHYGHHYGQVSGESREEDRRVDDGPFKDNWNFYYKYACQTQRRSCLVTSILTMGLVRKIF